MARDLPDSIAEDVRWLHRLIVAKGGGNLRQSTRMLQATDAASPVLNETVRTAVDKLFGFSALQALDKGDRARIAQLLEDLDNWRENKPSRAKFSAQMNLRLDTETQQQLSALAEESGEAQSRIIRRLIRAEYAKKSRGV